MKLSLTIRRAAQRKRNRHRHARRKKKTAANIGIQKTSSTPFVCCVGGPHCYLWQSPPSKTTGRHRCAWHTCTHHDLTWHTHAIRASTELCIRALKLCAVCTHQDSSFGALTSKLHLVGGGLFFVVGARASMYRGLVHCIRIEVFQTTNRHAQRP